MILIVVFCTLLIDYWQLTTATENNTQSCQLSLSIPLPHGEFQQFSNGSLLHQNILYHPDYLWNYSNTLYGCICQHQRKPCIRKCCKDDEVLYETFLLSECIKVNRSLPHLLPLNHQLVDELKHLKNLSHHFYLIQNKICPSGMYRLEPELYEEDNFVLLPNGSLQTLDRLLPQSQYCIDWQENLKNISVLVCHQPEKEDILPQTVIYPIGLIISILFLLATLTVYAVIPELRNLYGITLMCYVGCLTAAYCFLVSERFIYHGHVLCIVIV
ncbi:G-protein coupled receptor Mth2-like isoform X2 [Chelonus insularis]|uniref:G-protein coupled receptor Mth2-like isoform X2 n=1 Tax=Chelonus insularis TaxID=460826 RepID=UPI001589081D|nr:G-protein coupled receptor Mth2-like isoform X2 [Chelonus insularis]